MDRSLVFAHSASRQNRRMKMFTLSRGEGVHPMALTAGRVFLLPSLRKTILKDALEMRVQWP